MREGFQSASQMPSFQGKLKEDEITALTAFLKAMTDDTFIETVADGDLTKDEAASLGYADEEQAEADSSDENAGDDAAADVDNNETAEPDPAANN